MLTPDDDNLIFKTAADFINNTNHPVFLTGKAGTGKTTFLKYIRENTSKNTAVVAPTGVAAINAGGTTIHSFFQLPFGPFLPGNTTGWGKGNEVNDKQNLISKLRLTNERKEVMQQLELLIIDEISMVRCDVLDAIDTVLRHVRSIFSKPFGGVQVLYIGDMYQLPPVAANDWHILKEYYASEFFFSSQVASQDAP
ncbi:MAG: AAA family ATPase, partial [Ferruginibacter sp.]